MSEESDIAKASASPEGLKLVTRWIIIIVVLAAGMGGFVFLKNNGPEADKESPERAVPVVRVIIAESGEHKLKVVTQGRVEPRRRTQAASEVMGRVIDVSEKFKVGGVFKHNEKMLEIDSADYDSALANAQATEADAQLLLAQEEARSEQARRDWAKLGRGQPSDLVLRKPQIKSAEARVKAAEAAVAKASRDLKKTKLYAPYDCRVEAVYTDYGSYITPGARLADLYSHSLLEVRMPVTMEEVGYLKKTSEVGVGSSVEIDADLAGEKRTWHGKVVRHEGLVDRNTMTTHLVMQVEANEDTALYAMPPTGLVVRATITGRTLQNVIEIPRSALRQDNSVLTVTEEGELKKLPVKLARTMRDTVLVSSGLPHGSRVIVSPVEMPVDGMEVDIEETPEKPEVKAP